MTELIRLDKLLSNRGYCSRREVRRLISNGTVLLNGQELKATDQKVDPAQVTFEGQPLDPGSGILLMLNKPCGYTCSRSDMGQLVYELLPPRFSDRKPAVVSIGRLDKDTSGLLLFTDDGALVHRLTSPKHKVAKVYEVELALPLKGNEAQIFGAGDLLLADESDPLLPAEWVATAENKGSLKIFEGRYHQVRRMFAAIGNEVTKLHRTSVGEYFLGDLAEGEFKFIEGALKDC